MNEPKRRGRPPKARIPAIEQAPELSAREQIDAMKLDVVSMMAPEIDAALSRRAQAYAERVWSGQNQDLPRNERIARVKAALEGQSLPFEGVQLP